MAGLDGVINKIDPIKQGYGPYEADEFDPKIAINYLPFSLYTALKSLQNDYQFLLRDNIFNDALIEQWIETKNKEFNQISNWPSPIEYSMYFDF